MTSVSRVVGVLMVLAALGSSVPAQEVRGTGTAGVIPLWLDEHRIGDSIMSQGSDGALYATNAVGLTAFTGSQTATSGITFGLQGYSASPDGSGVQGYNVAAEGGWGVRGTSQSPNSVGVEGDSPSVGIRGQSLTCTSSGCTPQTGTAGQFIVGSGGTLLQGFVNVAGVWTSVFRVDSTGAGFFDGGTQTGGADFAESVATATGSNHYGPGDLLVLDTTADRRLTLSTEPYSTLVAGIYSTKPGVLATPHKLNAPASVGEIPLAIVGIVPCKVSAENGPIGRGDLLVTSSMPGYAMKGTDRNRMLGAVVGKAMEPLEKGTGVIQVLVTLQ